MIGDTYASLLQELASILGSDKLEPDENNSCNIGFPSGVEVQVELNSSETMLILLTELGDLSHGRYREQVLYEALRANDQNHPRYGNYAYNPNTEKLLLWDLLPMNNLNASYIASYLTNFVDKASECQKSLASNSLPAIPTTPGKGASSGPRGPFGLR